MDREDRVLAYIQDRLDTNARSSFEAELASDPALSSEVAALRAARREFATEQEASEASQGWDRLSATIDREEMGLNAPANTPGAPRFALWQVAAIVAVAVMLWEIAISSRFETSDPARYQTVSEGSETSVLQIVFKPDAPLGELAEILRDVDGTITDGPSAIGVYRVTFPDATKAQAAREVLSTRTRIVEMVLEQ